MHLVGAQRSSRQSPGGKRDDMDERLEDIAEAGTAVGRIDAVPILLQVDRHKCIYHSVLCVT